MAEPDQTKSSATSPLLSLTNNQMGLHQNLFLNHKKDSMYVCVSLMVSLYIAMVLRNI